MNSLPLLLTLLSSEVIHNLFDFTWTVPPKFVSGFRSTGEDIDALWNDADPSRTGCSTVPLTYLLETNHKTWTVNIKSFQIIIVYLTTSTMHLS